MTRLRLLAAFKRYTTCGLLYSLKNTLLLAAFVCVNARALASCFLRRNRPAAQGPRMVGILSMYRPMFWHGPIFEMHAYRWLERWGYQPIFIICHGFADVCDSHFFQSNKQSNPRVCQDCRLRHRAFFARNGARFLVLDEFVDRAAVRQEEHTIDRLQSITEAQLYRYGEVSLGNLVRLSVSRYFLRLTLNGEHLCVYKQHLRTAVSLHTAFSRLLRDYRFDNFLVFNGRYAMHGIPLSLIRAQNIAFTTYEFGDKESFLISQDDISVLWNDVAERYQAWRSNGMLSAERRQALQEFMEQRERHWVNSFSSVASDAEVDASDVLCCTNIVWDSAAFGRDTVFTSQFDWVTELISFCAARHLRLTIRIHPAETNVVYNKTREQMADRIARLCSTLPDGVRVVQPDDPTSSYDLLRHSKVLAVYSSTIGLEGAMAGEHVIVAGWTHYKGHGFTTDPRTKVEYFTELERMLGRDQSSGMEAARNYAYWYYLVHNKMNNTQLYHTPFNIPEDSLMLRAPAIPEYSPSPEFVEVMAAMTTMRASPGRASGERS